MARYSFRNATDKELTAGLNSSNQDENDAAMEEQMRRLKAGKVPTTANTMNKLATQDPGKEKPIKRNTGGTATNKKTYQVISPSEFHGAGPHITDSSVLLAKTSGSMTKKEARKAGLTGAGKRSATNKVIKRKSGGSAKGTQGQTSGKNFSGIY